MNRPPNPKHPHLIVTNASGHMYIGAHGNPNSFVSDWRAYQKGSEEMRFRGHTVGFARHKDTCKWRACTTGGSPNADNKLVEDTPWFDDLDQAWAWLRVVSAAGL